MKDHVRVTITDTFDGLESQHSIATEVADGCEATEIVGKACGLAVSAYLAGSPDGCSVQWWIRFLANYDENDKNDWTLILRCRMQKWWDSQCDQSFNDWMKAGITAEGDPENA